MKSYLIKILLIFSITVNSFAGEAVLLEQNKPAPFSGILFPKEQAEQMRKELLERDSLIIINKSLEESIKHNKDIIQISDLKINNLSEQNDNLAKSLYSERSMTNWERLAFFALGVIGTGLAVYGIKEATK